MIDMLLLHHTHKNNDMNREARIAARRKRVQEKLAAVRAQAEAASRNDAASATASQQQQQQQQAAAAAAAAHAASSVSQIAMGSAYSKAAQQVSESQRRLLRLKHRTTQEVTAVRVAADEAEAAHRAAEEQLRQVGVLGHVHLCICISCFHCVWGNVKPGCL